MNKLTAFLLALAFTFSACDNNDVQPNPQDPISVDDVLTVSGMSNDFGWDLFRQSASGVTDKNVLISPLSVQTALSMALNGADGATLTEMLNVLGCEGCSVKDLNTQTAKLRELMEEQSGRAKLTSANGYFFDESRIDVYDTFMQLLTADYKAGFASYDFSDPGTVDKINHWVSDHTNGKIDGIVDQISPIDLAFLINAVHFKADWATGFATDFTHAGKFTTADDREVDVDYVSADRNFTFVQNDDYAMVDVPFEDSTYSLSFIQSQNGLATDWVNALSSEVLKGMWQDLQYDRAFLNFPKLDLSYDNSMVDFLKALGMQQAFSEGAADFSQMGQPLIGPNIFISDVRHKAVLKVDEKGAEGAAVTSVTFSTTSLPPTFTFDRPFVIVLRHVPTNAMVFTGLVNDPS